MVEDEPLPIRERARKVVRAELTALALDLFLEHGYDHVTIEQIAEAAGMSRRTLFRYFASKDDLVISKYDLFRDRMVDALDARPEGEPVWDSLRRVFDITIDNIESDSYRARGEAIERMIHVNPQLEARYLERMQRLQEVLVDGVAARLRSAPEEQSLHAAALVGAAFAALHAAQAAWLSSARQQPFAAFLDAAMDAVRPLGAAGTE